MTKSRFKKFRTLFIVLGILVFCGALWLVDLGVSKLYRIEVVSIPEQTVAGNQAVFTVRVTDLQGRPKEGHLLAAVTYGTGSFLAYRVETDEEGLATFTYYTLPESRYNPAMDIDIQIRDESNSVFFEVNTLLDLTLHVVGEEEVNAE